MELRHLQYHHKGTWVELVLDRPDVFNALNKELLLELSWAFDEVGKDNGIRSVVLTGQGKAFCSGQDLKSVGGDLENIPFRKVIEDLYNPLILKMRNSKKPIICKLNGVAAGAGCSLALATDIIIANKEAYLAEIFAHIGLIMDAGSNYFLLERLGYPLAFELATTGRKVYADEAEKLGLINKSVEVMDLDDVVLQFVEIYANSSANAVALIKEMLNKAQKMNLKDVLSMEADFQEKAGKSSDFKEGVMAFLEKRKPKFK
ncbi:enoyl-CoA hydratase/isomerase family protein [Echinicola sp. 20G]|uniref:enoyl-CoA hydratase/isomerase family protein n=1 Tax=Echinicola sp. 20G TaxID=2781961 RepID=UPI0019110C33|nr:enoyl-CoA hydratase-related protein [Echinicola sp. 20G]